jgi:hypothetical protein
MRATMARIIHGKTVDRGNPPLSYARRKVSLKIKTCSHLKCTENSKLLILFHETITNDFQTSRMYFTTSNTHILADETILSIYAATVSSPKNVSQSSSNLKLYAVDNCRGDESGGRWASGVGGSLGGTMIRRLVGYLYTAPLVHQGKKTDGV